MITINELIAYLENLDGNMPVFIGDSSYGPMPLGLRACEIDNNYWIEGHRVDNPSLVLSWED